MDKEKKIRAIRRGLKQRESRQKGDELIFFCPRPKCKHYKPKLSVNVETDHFHCWICDWGGKNLAPLMAFGGETDESRLYRSEITTTRTPSIQQTQYDVPKLPKEYRSLLCDGGVFRGNALSYLQTRGITHTDDIVRWKLGYCELGEYAGHIIIPSFDEFGELNYFCGRKFDPLLKGQSYKSGNFSKDIVFNDYLIDWERPIYIVEGFFDAVAVGENAVPLSGSILREESLLFEKIVRNETHTYFALDTDAFMKQWKIMKKMISYGNRCSYINLKGRKDPSEIGRQEFSKMRENAVEINSQLDLARIRIDR